MSAKVLIVDDAPLFQAGMASALKDAGFEVVGRELFLIRPEYEVRYGMKARDARVLGRLPLVRETAVNGAFYLLRRHT